MTHTLFYIGRCMLLCLCILLTGAWVAKADPPFVFKTKNGLCGVVSDQGKLLVPPIYDHINPYREGYTVANRWKEKEYLLLDSLGRVAKKLEYGTTETRNVGGKTYYILTKDGKKGLMDLQGHVLIPPNTYTYLEPNPGTNMLWAVTNNWRGLVHPSGKELVMPTNSSQHVYYWYDGPIITREQIQGTKSIEVFDTMGRPILYDFPIADINSNVQLMARLREHKIIPASQSREPRSMSIGDYNRGWNEQITFLEKPKNEAFSTLFTYYCDNGWLLISNKWGDKRFKIDKNQFVFYRGDGTLAIQETFDNAKPFVNGYAPVVKKGKWGYIDTLGNWVVPPQFADAWQFYDGRALVAITQANKKKTWGFIDTNGRLVIRPMFTGIYQTNHGFKNGKFMGYVPGSTSYAQEEVHTIDTSGRVIAKAAYKDIDTRSIQVYYFNKGYDYMMDENRRNYAEALRLFEQALLFGEPKANVNMGYIYSKGGFGIERDIHKAIELYKKVDNEHAANNLAGIYLMGEVPSDTTLALQYMTKGAYWGSVTSMEQLARMYGRGKRVAKDSITGAFWVDRLFEKDSTSAMAAISYIKNGREPWQEYADAMAEMLRANIEATRNMTAAMEKYNQVMDTKLKEIDDNNLANAKKFLAAKEYKLAIQMLTSLTQSYHPEALYLMGSIYEKGEGVTRDLEKAKELYTLALSKGYEPARKALEQLPKK